MNLFNTLKSAETFEIVCRQNNAPGFTFWTVNSDYLNAHKDLTSFIKSYSIVQIKVKDEIVWSFVQSNSASTRKLTYADDRHIDFIKASYRVGSNPLPTYRSKELPINCDLPYWISPSEADDLCYSNFLLKTNVSIGNVGDEMAIFVGYKSLTHNTMEDIDFYFRNYNLIVTVETRSHLLKQTKYHEIKYRNFDSWYALFLEFGKTGEMVCNIRFSFCEDQNTSCQAYSGLAYGSAYWTV